MKLLPITRKYIRGKSIKKEKEFTASHRFQSHKEIEEGNLRQEFTERAKKMRSQMTLLLGAKRERLAILTKGLQRGISGHHLTIWCPRGAALNHNNGKKEGRHSLACWVTSNASPHRFYFPGRVL